MDTETQRSSASEHFYKRPFQSWHFPFRREEVKLVGSNADCRQHSGMVSLNFCSRGGWGNVSPASVRQRDYAKTTVWTSLGGGVQCGPRTKPLTCGAFLFNSWFYINILWLVIWMGSYGSRYSTFFELGKTPHGLDSGFKILTRLWTSNVTRCLCNCNI